MRRKDFLFLRDQDDWVLEDRASLRPDQIGDTPYRRVPFDETIQPGSHTGGTKEREMVSEGKNCADVTESRGLQLRRQFGIGAFIQVRTLRRHAAAVGVVDDSRDVLRPPVAVRQNHDELAPVYQRRVDRLKVVTKIGGGYVFEHLMGEDDIEGAVEAERNHIAAKKADDPVSLRQRNIGGVETAELAMGQETRDLIQEDAVAAADFENRPVFQFTPEREHQPRIVRRRGTGLALGSFELEPVNLFIEFVILASSVFGRFSGKDSPVEISLQEKMLTSVLGEMPRSRACQSR